MAEFHGTVELIAGITPKNGGDFALVGAHDVQVDDQGNRLDTEFSNLKSALNHRAMLLPDADDYGDSGQYPRSTGTGIEWTDYGLPSDEQTSQAVSDWLDEHPEATTTVQDGSISEQKLTPNIQKAIHYISAEEISEADPGIYTLGEITVTEPIRFISRENRGISIVNTVFNINTPVLFPAVNIDDPYFILPNFIGCTFNNALGERVLITNGSSDTVGSRFTNCYFNNVDAVADSGYVQDFSFVNCYINSYDTFCECENTVQIRLVNCTVERESEKLIDANRLIAYISGTYENSDQKNFYRISCNYGIVEFNTCYFESEKIIEVLGGASNIPSDISFIGCFINGHITSDLIPAKFVHPEYVNLSIFNSVFTAYNYFSKFTDVSPNDFASLHGKFTIHGGECYPFNNENTNAFTFATINDINESNSFSYRLIKITQEIVDSGDGVNMSLPTGQYVVFVSTSAYSVIIASNIYLCGASIERNTRTEVSQLYAADSAMLRTVQLTASKANIDDAEFTVNLKLGYPQTLLVDFIKLH